MPILTVGGDESNHGDKIGPSLFAAYGAYFQVWETFVDEWQGIVRCSPDLWPYHSHDWHNPQWLEERGETAENVSRREIALCELIARTPFLFHVTSAVSAESFYSTIANYVPSDLVKKKRLRWATNPYHFCHADVVRKSISFASEWNRLHASADERIEQVNMFVDDNESITEDATRNFNKARDVAPPDIAALMGRHVPVSKKTSAEVQAADLLAYEYLTFYRSRVRRPSLDLVTRSRWLRTEWSPLRLRDIRDVFILPLQQLSQERTRLRTHCRAVYLPQKDGPLEPSDERVS